MAAIKAKATTIGHGAAEGGPFTLIASILGEVPVPEHETPVEKIQANDDTDPDLIIGDEAIGDIEVKVKYTTHAAAAATEAIKDQVKFFEFTLDTGDTYEYEGVLNKIGIVTGAENGGGVGTLGFVLRRLVGSTAGA